MMKTKILKSQTEAVILLTLPLCGELLLKMFRLFYVEGHSTVVYFDFARDVDEVTEILWQGGCKVGKYTGQINIDDRKIADRKFLAGDLTVFIATKSFELGVDNPNISQVIRIGCPRNLGVLLQEVGRAGRKPESSAKWVALC